jgi:truncated hemoglobin YjbI
MGSADLERSLVDLHVSKDVCPFSDVSSDPFSSAARCPFHKTLHRRTEPASPERKPVAVAVRDGTYHKSGGSAQLLRDIGGGDRVRQMTTRFYARAFQDFTLSSFMFKDDGAAPHGQRLGDWIVEKMGGEGDAWTNSGRGGMRQESHAQAWMSVKRRPDQRGKRFKLDDCRVWMRIMFWAARDVGLHEHKAFWDWYVAFIAHFIAVYEMSAPPYAKESAEWSASEDNLQNYIRDGHKMNDVIGIGRR